MIIARLFGAEERLVAIDPEDVIHDLDVDGLSLIPAADDSWLVTTSDGLLRLGLA